MFFLMCYKNMHYYLQNISDLPSVASSYFSTMTVVIAFQSMEKGSQTPLKKNDVYVAALNAKLSSEERGGLLLFGR